MQPLTLDHVAVWVVDRDRVADFAAEHLGMHVIERTDRFTLVGADARRGKLTLFEAAAPRSQGALEHVALRVSDLAASAGVLPPTLAIETPRPGELYFELSDGLRLGLVEAPTESEYDLDHVALRASNPAAALREYARLGFREVAPGASGHPRVEVGGAFVELWPGGDGAEPDNALLNHLGLLVESADAHISAAHELGVEIADVVDAPNTYAVFVWGPEGVKLEYVEHKPTFALA